ncbi:lipopolysaccharide assembly protein LapA domain-containing protein [Geodermatophilus maliterrae]|uniref:Lipopolysaccharide assembly protein LapA domain-containing protein n=1 Tax=Geodermatophilus maliterrae TaxID=3162531 RepID=A0ABV3XJ94_9ACTN
MTAPGSPPDPRYSAPGTDPTAARTTPSAGSPYPDRSSSGTSSPGTTSRGTTSRAGAAGRTIGRGLALGLLLFVTVILVLFVVFNGQTVQISLVFTDVQAPLVLALVIAAVLGALVAALAGLVSRARRRSR